MRGLLDTCRRPIILQHWATNMLQCMLVRTLFAFSGLCAQRSIPNPQSISKVIRGEKKARSMPKNQETSQRIHSGDPAGVVQSPRTPESRKCEKITKSKCKIPHPGLAAENTDKTPQNCHFGFCFFFLVSAANPGWGILFFFFFFSVIFSYFSGIQGVLGSVPPLQDRNSGREESCKPPPSSWRIFGCTRS